MRKLPQNLPSASPKFVEPMQCKLVGELPAGKDWVYELKLDGYRALGMKNGKNVQLISRNGNNLNRRYPELARALTELPFEAILLDGEIVVLDEQGRPSFQRLQDLGGGDTDRSIYYYAFDLLNFHGRDLRKLPLLQRKEILQSILPKDRIVRYAAHLEAETDSFVTEVRKLGIEGVVAKRKTSLYESGKRTGSWVKFKLDNEQEFVVGGYRPSGLYGGFDALLIGYYENGKLLYAAKLRAGFADHAKKQLSLLFPKYETQKCPFVNLPEGKVGRWGEGLTAENMEKYTWLKPKIVIRAKFTEWTSSNHLRHVKFVALRDDKNPKEVVRE
ncbi:non-homologous end-joining DNA ligase [bacterium]|nr:non-homologous end-joining DNA ligase [bacterium]MCI0601706.1 non-homologous end-joining DNA ligase [bacterium]